MAEPLDSVFSETIARHFPEARISDGVIDLGFGGLQMKCEVPTTQAFGQGRAASLYMRLWGGAVGEHPVFLSVSGYGDDDHDAVVVGGCNWACTFGPVLRAGLAAESLPDLAVIRSQIEGRPVEVFVDGLDRLMSTDEPPGELGEATRRARAGLGGDPWLTGRLLASSWLPLLDPERPTVLSVFVFDLPERRIVEV